MNEMYFLLAVFIINFYMGSSLRVIYSSTTIPRSKFQVAKASFVLHNHIGMPDDDGSIIIEVVTRRRISQDSRIAKIVAYDTVYKEVQDDKVSRVMDSPALKVVEILLNPLTLCLALYVSSIGWNRVLWLQKILKIFGKGTLANKKDSKTTEAGAATASPELDLPYQVFECDSCGMELRPARGRAEIIFGRERFRCSRCGAKASSYFDIDDMNDPRAVARVERLKLEKQREEEEDNDEDSDE